MLVLLVVSDDDDLDKNCDICCRAGECNISVIFLGLSSHPHPSHRHIVTPPVGLLWVLFFWCVRGALIMRQISC